MDKEEHILHCKTKATLAICWSKLTNLTVLLVYISKHCHARSSVALVYKWRKYILTHLFTVLRG